MSTGIANKLPDNLWGFVKRNETAYARAVGCDPEKAREELCALWGNAASLCTEVRKLGVTLAIVAGVPLVCIAAAPLIFPVTAAGFVSVPPTVVGGALCTQLILVTQSERIADCLLGKDRYALQFSGGEQGVGATDEPFYGAVENKRIIRMATRRLQRRLNPPKSFWENVLSYVPR